MDITLNYFELFQLPVSCDVDSRQLALRYRELQKAVHPDRYAGNADRQQRLSVQYAAYVNEAYEALKEPLSRYLYLLQLVGKPVDMEKNTVMDSAFLMEQMALRESVAELKDQVNPSNDFEALVSQVDNKLTTLFDKFSHLWAEGSTKHLDQAEVVVRKIQFLIKVAAELEQLESELFD